MFENPFASLNVSPANDTGAERDPVQEVFLHMPTPEGEHVFRISLLPDGSADLSGIPAHLQESWRACGEQTLPTIRTETARVIVRPEQGVQFLKALLNRPVGGSGVWFSTAPQVNESKP